MALLREFLLSRKDELVQVFPFDGIVDAIAEFAVADASAFWLTRMKGICKPDSCDPVARLGQLPSPPGGIW
jgi:hypothetical protein